MKCFIRQEVQKTEVVKKFPAKVVFKNIYMEDREKVGTTIFSF